MKISTKAGLGLAIVGLSAIMATAAGAQNLVTNPGFETGNFSGWTQAGNTGFTGVTSGVYAHSGTYGAFFGPVGSDGSISQSLATTAGQSYNISFWLENEGNPINDFSASFNGDTLVSQANDGPFGYTQFSFTDVATSNSTPLVFSFRQDPSYWGLDDISVTATATPEPSQAAILGIGVLGLAALALRKRKVNA